MVLIKMHFAKTRSCWKLINLSPLFSSKRTCSTQPSRSSANSASNARAPQLPSLPARLKRCDCSLQAATNINTPMLRQRHKHNPRSHLSAVSHPSVLLAGAYVWNMPREKVPGHEASGDVLQKTRRRVQQIQTGEDRVDEAVLSRRAVGEAGAAERTVGVLGRTRAVGRAAGLQSDNVTVLL